MAFSTCLNENTVKPLVFSLNSLGCKGSSQFLQASVGNPAPGSVDGGSLLGGSGLVLRWFYHKTNGVSTFFDLRKKMDLTIVIITHNKELSQMTDRKLSLIDGKWSE